jgi:hypothetical protein
MLLGPPPPPGWKRCGGKVVNVEEKEKRKERIMKVTE